MNTVIDRILWLPYRLWLWYLYQAELGRRRRRAAVILAKLAERRSRRMHPAGRLRPAS